MRINWTDFSVLDLRRSVFIGGLSLLVRYQFPFFQMDAARAVGGGLRVVCDHDHSFAGVAAERAEDFKHFGGRVGIEIAGRFVGDN